MEINELSPGGGMAVAAPFNYQQEQEKLKQQQLLAQSLMKSKMPEGQMVSGWYVAPKGSQYLAAGLDKLMGAYGQYQANEQADGVETKRKQLLTDALSKFGQVDADGNPVKLNPGQQLQYAQTAMELDPEGIGRAIGANTVNNIINPKSTLTELSPGAVLYDNKTGKVVASNPKQVDPAAAEQKQQLIDLKKDQVDTQKRAADDKREEQKQKVGDEMAVLDKHQADIGSANALITNLMTHKGFDSAIGLQGAATRRIPGTDAANYATLVEQLKSQGFMQTIQGMRGLGALSDAEGAKIMSSIGNLDYAQSKDQFKKTLTNIQNSFNVMQKQAEAQAGNAASRYKSLGGKYMSMGDVKARAEQNGWDINEATDYLVSQGYKIGK